ncbi:CubicO group peptidase (beta-lactamase class C family) [Sphingomonas sp. PP-CE-1A-559]|uniref:serine hydrolase domain-containing protein n=1 Tax=Sphingomonas sp. PP-CE-1A-559 TaxID=2135657 RepID=UPI00105660A6|nr:serine hydrolase domain-containing protein [Sphingomonas sp. PP-CE-1A-559]TCP87962.1 CubicO group peptidase (beta-lactamase class C family) [Sphingomonas sp. PP-CE-1A-559]
MAVSLLAAALLAIVSPALAGPEVQPRVTSPQPLEDATLSPARRAGVEVVVRVEMKRRAIPGLQLAIVRRGRIVFQGAYGIADEEAGAPATAASLFTLNSATKAFTGVAVMQLVQAGKLSLDSPASDYVDDLPASWKAITIRQLLTHVSGLPEILDLPNGQGTGTLIGRGGEDSAWSTVKLRPLEARPGVSYSYNQTNYVLLGKIIDRVAGVPFAQYIKAHEFEPAGATHLVFGDARDVVPGRVRTYRYANGTVDGSETGAPLEHAFDEFSPFLRTAGGLNGSATDVARWLIALENGTLVDKRTLDIMWTPGRFADGKPTTWGMGWPLRTDVMHPAATGIGGRRSAFFVYPKDDLAIVVLTNLAGANPEEFIVEIAGVLNPELRHLTP